MRSPTRSAAQFGLAEVPPFAVEVPPNRALGDLAVPVAFQLARTLRKAPRAIAQELAAGARRPFPASRAIVAAPNGYLNLFLDRRAFLLAAPARRRSRRRRAAPEKTIVEHTAINPNKAAHIGHLRNAALGDTLVRVLRFRGTPVEVQNYIDDTGVQVADIIVGFRELEQQTLDERAARSPTRRGSITTAGTCTRGSPSGTTATSARLAVRARGAARSRARRQRRPPRWARSSSIASSARTSRRWRG